MAINLSGLGNLWGALSGIAQMNGLAETAEAQTNESLNQASMLIHQARETALSQARATAEAEGRQPNLTDYWHAAMLQPDLQQNPRMVADLSGMTLDGFVIRAEDINPNAQTRAVMGDIYDLDSNGEINVEAIDDFFREASAHMNFNNVQFHNVTFQPATTLEVFAHAHGAQFANITLDGLGAGETLTIGTGGEQRGTNRESYSNVRVINDQGGIIRVNSNATVNGLMLENGNTVLEVAAGGRVNLLDVNNETVSLRMQPMGELFLPSFDGANFTPASTLAGAIIRGNPMDAAFHGFRNSNLNGLSFENANISGVDFAHCNVNGTNFSGARLSSVTFSQEMDLTAAKLDGLRAVHNVQIMDSEGRVVRTLNDTNDLRSYIAEQQTAKDRNGGELPAIALTEPANRTESVARSLNLSWNGEVSSYQNDNSLVSQPAVATVVVSPAETIATLAKSGNIAPRTAEYTGGIMAGGEVSLSDVLDKGAPTAETPEQRMAQAEARIAMMERNDELTVMRG